MYDKKPEHIKSGTLMHQAFKMLIKDSFMNINEFTPKMQKNAIWPAYQYGFLKVYKNGLVRINAAGKKLYASAK